MKAACTVWSGGKVGDNLKDFLKLISNGVFATPANSMHIQAAGGMKVKVTPGWAFINCKWLRLDNDYYITLDKADVKYSRVDRIVLRLDPSDEARNITIQVKKGDAKEKAYLKSLERVKNGVWELSLGYVWVHANATEIRQSNIVDLFITLSAALAFVVLFTLSSTNISERERELATIKVLGFYDREVHFYINKEIMLLTVTAILLGLPTGAWLCGLLTDILKMPSLYFQVYIEPVSFVYSGAITLLFSLFVNIIMHRTLDSIDPAEALKSIE